MIKEIMYKILLIFGILGIFSLMNNQFTYPPTDGYLKKNSPSALTAWPRSFIILTAVIIPRKSSNKHFLFFYYSCSYYQHNIVYNKICALNIFHALQDKDNVVDFTKGNTEDSNNNYIVYNKMKKK